MAVPEAEQFQPLVAFDKTITITGGGQVSAAAAYIGGCTLCGLFLPATFTGTTLTFSVSKDGTNFVTMQDGAGSSYTKTVANGTYCPLPPADFAGVRWLKITSGSSEGADRVITLAVRPV